MQDANESALAKHLQKEEESEIEYNRMLDELDNIIEVDINDKNEDAVKVVFNKIVKRYGFEYDFEDWVKENER